ncbi:hypothetical protein SAMN04488128_102575 [Chitinophaga eiseniae]|uniref:Uncharacterized protein n=1 Tax=Chitinophaga eiseniae TaxID=634771 RepID=A0A1T4QSU9_9BACT|nr:hypothetical protein [Chitinophaga eiseniae]SKA06790.1 hypothetical protein SAMN04488128_102575 [Chitinophaga eiseniae]
MTKTYKVSYKTYFNDRLKQVFFHGKLTYPLYVQVTFDRKTIFFKSYYFELFSKPRYFLSVAGLSGGPSIEDIIKKENILIDFIIDKNLPDFSLDLFKKEYAYYSKDLCDVTEEGFIDYMYVFFQDKGMPNLATTVQQGSRFRIVYDVVRDMKRAFNKPLYDELVENSFYYAPPYLPLYGFMQQTKKWPMLSLTVMEWEDEKTKDQFADYVQKYYPNIALAEITEQVNKWLDHLRKEAK